MAKRRSFNQFLDFEKKSDAKKKDDYKEERLPARTMKHRVIRQFEYDTADDEVKEFPSLFIHRGDTFRQRGPVYSTGLIEGQDDGSNFRWPPAIPHIRKKSKIYDIFFAILTPTVRLSTKEPRMLEPPTDEMVPLLPGAGKPKIKEVRCN